MTSTYEIEKFENIIEIGTTFGKNWFRGHSKIVGELTPGIFRSYYANEVYLSLNPSPEFRIAEDFKRKAPSITKDLPDYNNHVYSGQTDPSFRIIDPSAEGQPREGKK